MAHAFVVVFFEGLVGVPKVLDRRYRYVMLARTSFDSCDDQHFKR